MAEETTTTMTNTSQDTQNASQNANTDSATVNTTNADNDTQANSSASQNTPSIEELIQRAVDRATNKLGNDNKKLRESIEKLKNENLTAEQRKQLELQEKEADIADREAKLQEKENRDYALKAIKEAGLDDGGTRSLELIDFVVCDNETDTLKRVKLFGELVDKFVKAEVDKTFKMNGRNPNSTTNATDSSNQSNIAEQLGKVRAEAAKKSNDTLNYYYGGK